MASIFRKNTGHQLNEESWLAAGKRHAELLRQSEIIADKLGQSKIDAYRQQNMAIALVNLITGESQPVVSYRNSNLIPIVQSANHRDALKTLEYYCYKHPYVRMMVITSGERCKVQDVRERHQKLSRQISKWAASSICKKRGIKVIFARHELTFNELLYVHLHAHVLVNCTRKLGGKEWGKFLKATDGYFGAKILDSGLLKKPAEAIKYCLKPGEIEDKSPNLIGELFNQLHGQKLCRFMGGLAEMRKELEKGHLKVGKRKEVVDGAATWVPCLIRKEGNGGAKYKRKSTKPARDIVLGLTSPCAIFKPVLEPCLVVGNYSGNLKKLLSFRELKDWQDAAMEGVKHNSTVHTSTTTVPQ